MGEQAQENHSSATNLPAWGLKEIADLSVSRALLCWVVVVADWSGPQLWEEGDILEGQAL